MKKNQKKLDLNKRAISGLNKNTINQIQGGGIGTITSAIACPSFITVITKTTDITAATMCYHCPDPDTKEEFTKIDQLDTNQN